MRHCDPRACTVPMLLSGPNPDDITWPDFFDRTARALHSAEARGDDQGLTEWMRMPRRVRTRFEGDARTADTRGLRRLEQRIDAYCAREPVRRTFRGRLRPSSFDFHINTPCVNRSFSCNHLINAL